MMLQHRQRSWDGGGRVWNPLSGAWGRCLIYLDKRRTDSFTLNGASTPVKVGTSPDITVSGTCTVPGPFCLEIVSNGVRGVAMARITGNAESSTPSWTTFTTGTAVTQFGLTIQFSAGSYSTDTYWTWQSTLVAWLDCTGSSFATVKDPNNISTANWGTEGLSSRTATTLTDNVNPAYGYHGVNQASVPGLLLTGPPATLTFEAKAGTKTYVYMQPSGISAYARFYLVDGSVVGSSGCTPSSVAIGDGWYRYDIVFPSGYNAQYWRMSNSAVDYGYANSDGTGTMQLRNVQVTQRGSLAQSGATLRPSYYTTGIDFSSGKYLQSPTLNPTAPPATVYVVASTPSTPTESALIACGTGGAAPRLSVGDAVRNAIFTGDGVNSYTSSSEMTLGQVSIFAFTSNGASSTVGCGQRVLTGGAGMGASLSVSQYTLGYNPATTLPWGGKILFVAGYDKLHTPTMIASYEQALSTIFGAILT